MGFKLKKYVEKSSRYFLIWPLSENSILCRSLHSRFLIRSDSILAAVSLYSRGAVTKVAHKVAECLVILSKCEFKTVHAMLFSEHMLSNLKANLYPVLATSWLRQSQMAASAPWISFRYWLKILKF